MAKNEIGFRGWKTIWTYRIDPGDYESDKKFPKFFKILEILTLSSEKWSKMKSAIEAGKLSGPIESTLEITNLITNFRNFSKF